ncbi:putative RNA recognition motif 2 [Lyophyllum shimeji]|uniref:RNA recognition motif 2 n=1 Tax=Lyophyllum shimeji TaxID=47721 RepID=A0A9P3ULD4_LYOSH|nr:putative RNA recognition motif 2 [Lyophyllum shimeji]
MSSATFHARSSVDLGARENPLANMKPPRSHPPRLQHSPSLPNIWFPPHSGPIPPQFEDISRQPLQRPSTPPVVTADETLSSPARRSDASEKKLEHRESASFDDIAHLHQTPPLRIHRRRRVDRDQGQGHSLLTPPLTPSSSLRTTTSVDSAGNADASSEAVQRIYGDEADCEATRFLLLSNISRQIRHDILRGAIVGSLTAPPVDASDASNTLAVPASSVQVGPLSEDAIKGVFLRRQQSDGMAMLAFFDVRHAEIAKQILSVPTTGPLSHCVGDDLREDGTRAWIGCRFITAEELVEIIGNSLFLASTEGSFYLAVEASGVPHGRELKVTEAHSIVADAASSESVVDSASEGATSHDDLNLSMLKSFLQSFGGLRSFSSVIDKLDATQPSAKTFHIEYYDARAAISAYTSIDGQILFGMKLSVFGREDLSDSLNVRQQSQERCPAAAADAANSDASNDHTALPITLSGLPNEATMFGPPGQYSHARERFRYVEDPQSRPRSVGDGQELFSNHVSPAPSPTYFYTSHPVEHGAGTGTSHEGLGQSLPNTALYNSAGGFHRSPGSSSEPSINSANGVDTREWPCEVGVLPNRQLGINGYHDCYYCPSRGSPSSATSDCYVPCSTPSPYSHQPDLGLQPLSNVPYPTMLPPAHASGYDYDASHPRPISATMAASMANLAFEHAMMTGPRPFVSENWFSESPSTVHAPLHGAPYCGPLLPVLGAPNTHYVPLNGQDTSPQFDSAVEGFPNFLRSARPGPSPHPPRGVGITRPQGSSVGARELRVSAEHNQLNLARIEDGQDTRTTVMIKNIPNKMADKDLIAYIGKVCPRRIDFLYLRMDFQNGCNVGYAFVNFITVQDLLYFAKKKLGEKWNMFSSEKVLQMSYANYQGKEALVEKFKNSCIMDEREAWRPKIFYSEPGPEQGLPEPFPAPTHIRRKERSAFNRGALYVPGVWRGTSAPQSNAYPRRLEDTRRNIDRPGQNWEQSNQGPYPSVGSARRRSNTKL